jgi:hypothetical protein
MKNQNLRPRTLHGGPWAGKVSDIPKGGTLVFTLGEHHGFYKGDGHWIEMPRPDAKWMTFDEVSEFK